MYIIHIVKLTMSTFEKFCDNAIVRCVLMALVLVLLICCLKMVIDLKDAKESEHLAYSAGADLRFLSRPTSTDQGRYTTGYNMEKDNALKRLISSTGGEHFAPKKEIRNSLAQEEVLASQLYTESFTDMESPDEKVINELQTIGEYM